MSFKEKRIIRQTIKLTDILERAEETRNFYEKANKIREFNELLLKSNQTTYSAKDGKEVVLRYLFEETNEKYQHQTLLDDVAPTISSLNLIQRQIEIGFPNMKQTLDELFEPRKDYQMIENVLQEIGITRQEVEEYTCEHKKKELEDKLELFMNDIRIAEETRTLTTEHFLVANYILSEIKSLERSFGTEKTNNNLNCKILFNKTMSSVEFYLNKIENPKHGIFFNNYQKRINILEMFEKKLSFTDREQNIVENIKHELNKKAVKVTVQAYNEYLKIPVAERAKEPNYTLNQAFINTVYETINGINNSSTKYELTKLVEELDVKNKVDMSKQRELILEQEKKLCGYVDSKINSTMEEFHKAIEIWYNFEITYFGIMEKTLENITQQAKGIINQFNTAGRRKTEYQPTKN